MINSYLSSINTEQNSIDLLLRSLAKNQPIFGHADQFILLTRIFHESVTLSLKDLVHKGIFLGVSYLLIRPTKKNFFVDQRLSENVADSWNIRVISVLCRRINYPHQSWLSLSSLMSNFLLAPSNNEKTRSHKHFVLTLSKISFDSSRLCFLCVTYNYLDLTINHITIT